MQYQNFPAAIQSKKTGMIAAFIIGVAVLFVALMLFFSTFAEIKTPVDITAADLKNLENGAVYKIDELYVVDSYAEYGETANPLSDKVTKVEKYYFTCMLFDGSDELYTISMQAKPTDSIMPAINAYLADDEQFIGDLVLSGYFTARPNGINGELLEYYEESVAMCEEVFELTQLNTDLVFECDGDADYIEYAQKEQNSMRIMAIAFTVFSLLMFLVGFLSRKKYHELLAAKEEADKKAAAEAEFAAF